MRKQILASLCVVSAACFGAVGVSADSAFEASRKEILKDPSLIRYYTFEDGHGDEVTNHAKPVEPGRIAFTGGPVGSLTLHNPTAWGVLPNMGSSHTLCEAPMEWVPGRHPGKSAVRSGETPLGLYRSGITGREFAKGATFAGWFLFESKEGGCNMISLGDAWNNGFRLSRSRHLLEFRLSDKGKPVAVYSGAVEPETWHHVAATVGDGKVRLYVDGRLASEKPVGFAIVPVKGSEYPTALPFFENSRGHATYLLIGANGRGAGRPAPARFRLDELAIYDRALSADEVGRLHVAGKPQATADEQRAAFAAWRAKDALDRRIRMDLPRDTGGFFRIDKPVPATVALPAEMTGAYKAVVDVETLEGKHVRTIEKTLAGGGTVKEDVRFPACGVYWVDFRVETAAGALVKRLPAKFCVAIVPPAPARLSENNPMAYWADWLAPFHYDAPTRRMQMHGDGTHFEEMYAHYRKVIPDFRAYMWFYSLYARPPKEGWEAGRKKNHDFFTMAARRFQDKNIIAFEMSSEPHNIDVKWYVQHLADARKIFNDAGLTQPMVPPGGAPPSIPMISDILKAGGAAYMDGVSYHPYTPHPIKTYLFENPTDRLKNVLKAYPKKFSLWNTESGIEALPRVNHRPMTRDEAYAMRWPSREGLFLGFIANVPEAEAAALVAQDVLLHLLNGYRIYTHCGAPLIMGDPGLNSVALTALAGQVLNDFAGIARLPLAGITDMCLFVKQADGSRIAAVFAERPTLLTFRLAPATTYKTMDVYGNYGTVKTDGEGILAIPATLAPFYVFGVPADMAEVAPLAFDLPGEISERGEATGTITVKNSFSRRLTGTLAAEPVFGAELAFSADKIDLKPGESTRVDFFVHGKNLKRKAYQFNVNLKDASGKTLASASRIARSPGVIRMIPRVTREMPLDGDLAKWKGVPALACDTLEGVVHGKPNYAEIWVPQWLGKDDLSFSVKTCWRKGDGIYFLLDVTDDTVLPAPEDKTALAFRYDCLELFFDSRPAAQQGSALAPGADQAMIVPRATARATPCTQWFARNDKEHVTVTCVGRKTERGWLVEGRIAPNERSEFRIQAGSQFMMDFLVDDTDRDELKWLRKSAMALDGNFGNSQNSNIWGRYELSLDE